MKHNRQAKVSFRVFLDWGACHWKVTGRLSLHRHIFQLLAEDVSIRRALRHAPLQPNLASQNQTLSVGMHVVRLTRQDLLRHAVQMIPTCSRAMCSRSQPLPEGSTRRRWHCPNIHEKDDTRTRQATKIFLCGHMKYVIWRIRRTSLDLFLLCQKGWNRMSLSWPSASVVLVLNQEPRWASFS